jgi:hypothetical protein
MHDSLHTNSINTHEEQAAPQGVLPQGRASYEAFYTKQTEVPYEAFII